MKITPEQVYAIVGLKVGDKVNIKDFTSNPHIVAKDCLIDKKLYRRSISLLVANEFEKVESKIWDIDEIRKGNKYYCINKAMQIECCEFESYGLVTNEKYILKQSIAFKKEEYAQKYKEKLIEFNENYKKECE